jgi:hypothetical protein
MALPDLPAHLKGGPGLYVLDLCSRGLILRTLLQDSKAVAAALEDTSNEPSELQVKVEETFGIFAAKKLIDKQVCCTLHPVPVLLTCIIQ